VIKNAISKILHFGYQGIPQLLATVLHMKCITGSKCQFIHNIMAITDWQQSNIQYFWGEIAPNQHLVQIYDDEGSFLNSLEGFAGSGFLAGDSVILIATGDHLKALNQRLMLHGFNINKLISEDRYLPLDADETLENFMIDGHPDEKRFMKLADGIVKRARKEGGRKVRAFGEMVAILSSRGNSAATMELENLWNKFCDKEPLTLFCAYPRNCMTSTAKQHICSAHSKIVSGTGGPSTQVFYKEVSKKVNASL
jgi:hypothetical protein